MKVLVVLVLVVFTGCHANVVQQNQNVPQLDMVKDAFWDYVAKATLTAEDTLERIKQSELGQGVNAMISESADAVNKYSVALRGQVTPLTQDLLGKLTQEAEVLKARLDQDLSSVRTQLKPYAEELNEEIQRQVEELKSQMIPYVEALDSEALKATLNQKSEELKVNLEKSVKALQSQMVPFSEELKQKMELNLEAFQRSMVPLTQSFTTELVQRSQELQKSLAPYGEELKKLEINAQDLKAQLTALWESFTQKSL